MPNSNITEIENFVKFVKTITGDNGERKYEDKMPCVMSPGMKKSDIDNPSFCDNQWQDFWRICKKYFPLHSVCGGSTYSSPSKITAQEMFSLRNHLSIIYGENWHISNKKVLEIGYGYGGAGSYFINNCKLYRGIDYVSSSDDLRPPHFNEIKKSGIPEKLRSKKYDLVYSTNVFQHLTQKQRFEYIEQAYDVLNEGGILYFDVFEPKGDDLPEDFSTHFFDVHTKVDTREELTWFIMKTGFKIKKYGVHNNLNENTDWVYYVCEK